MDVLFTEAFVAAFFFGAVTAGVPLLLAGLGEQISEKAGVLNVGMEGMMLAGAYAGFAAAFLSQSFLLGFLAGALAGLGAGLVMALLCVVWGMNQIVVGIAITLGAEGITALLHHIQFARSYPRLSRVEVWPLPGLADLPWLGAALFERNPLVYLAFALVFVVAWVFRRTQLGLDLQAAGDMPAALDAAGVSVTAVRFAAVLAAGLMGGVGGAYLATVGGGLFLPFMTGGAGFIAIVLAMLARGRPLWVLLGAMLFGASLALTTALQVAGVDIPTDVIQMLPFAMVIAVLVIFARHSHLPPALGIPYRRGER